MRRTVFNVVSALSLVACVATIVLWVRSYWFKTSLTSEFAGVAQPLNWDITLTGGDCFFESGCATSNRLLRHRGILYFDDSRHDPPRSVSVLIGDMKAGWWPDGFLGIYFRTLGLNRYLVLPCWCLVFVFAVLPACRSLPRLRKWYRRRYRLTHGLCVNCGYDLRATPQANGPLLARCPECGSEAHASAPSG